MNITLRRYYPWLIAFVVIITALVLTLGNTRVIAYTVPGSQTATPADAEKSKKNNITNATGLFSNSVVHSIQILISDADYQKMITTYRTTGQKDWFQADVVIDGVRINQVGLRLKGNASLRTALGSGMGGKGGQLGQFGQPPAGGFQMPADGFQPPEGGFQMPNFGGQPPADLPNGAAPQFNPRQQGGGRQAPGGLPNNQNNQNNPVNPGIQPGQTAPVSVDVKIPMLIKFDQFVEGQRYQGFSAVAIRSYGTSQDAAMLNEPLTNDVFKLMGQVAPRTAYAGVKINDQAEKLYTLAEQINGTYIETYFPDSEGVLYKAEMGADFRYLGEDPSAYMRLYSQHTLINDADMAPLIEFTKFLTQSDDATFERELAQHLDVDAFATYLAINNLLVNSDSLADMGNNFYLYYSPSTAQMEILYWDGNESLGKIADRGGSGAAQYNLYYESLSGMGQRVRNNVLKQRFLANATFKALYEEKLRLGYEKAFASGWLDKQIKSYASLITGANAQRSLVGQSAYDLAVAKVQNFIQQRGAYLAQSELIKK